MSRIRIPLDGRAVGQPEPGYRPPGQVTAANAATRGVILLPPLSDHPIILGRLADVSIPTVRIAPKNEPGSNSPSVGIDDYAAARRMTGHLLDLGHRRIGFILGRQATPLASVDIAASATR